MFSPAVVLRTQALSAWSSTAVASGSVPGGVQPSSRPSPFRLVDMGGPGAVDRASLTHWSRPRRRDDVLLHACGAGWGRSANRLESTPAKDGVSHPRTRLDDLIHQPVRLSIMAALAKAEELQFRFLRDALDVSDSVLSRQAWALEEVGYVAIRQGFGGKATGARGSH